MAKNTKGILGDISGKVGDRIYTLFLETFIEFITVSSGTGSNAV